MDAVNSGTYPLRNKSVVQIVGPEGNDYIGCVGEVVELKPDSDMVYLEMFTHPQHSANMIFVSKPEVNLKLLRQ